MRMTRRFSTIKQCIVNRVAAARRKNPFLHVLESAFLDFGAIRASSALRASRRYACPITVEIQSIRAIRETRVCLDYDCV